MEPANNIRKAIRQLRNYGSLSKISTTWETPPVGTSGPNFYNTAVLYMTNLNAEDLDQDVLKPIEAALGRVRTEDKYASRPIDLDIIIFDDQVIDSALWTHPHILIPVSEITPELINHDDIPLHQLAKNKIGESGMHPHPEILRADEY